MGKTKKKLRPKPHPKAKSVKPARPAPRSETALIRQAIEASSGIMRLAPTWVPRSFLVPGRRLRLAPQDLYALGAHRGGIDERWFASTTPAANEGAPPDEGLSYIVVNGRKTFTLREAVALEGPRLIGATMFSKYQRWPVYSKF